MTDAAQTHLTQVRTAKDRTDELASAIEALGTSVNEAIGHIGAIIDGVIEKAEAAGTAADNTIDATSGAMATGETYLEATSNAGDGTIGLAQVSKEESDFADNSTRGLKDRIDTITGALGMAKEEATKAVQTCGAAIEDISTGVDEAKGHLGEAEINVDRAINII